MHCSFSVVIPARLESTRLPRKLLADLCGKPVLWHVWNQLRSMKGCSELCIATDAPSIEAIATDWGAKVRRTQACSNGTERIASILPELKGDWIVNVQGDEPFIEPSLVEDLMRFAAAGSFDMVTAARALEKGEAEDSHCVKLVADAAHRALYFSRANIAEGAALAHLGIYAYKRSALERYPSYPIGPLERAETLEQLRFLEQNHSIGVLQTTHACFGIDTADDLKLARSRLAKARAAKA